MDTETCIEVTLIHEYSCPVPQVITTCGQQASEFTDQLSDHGLLTSEASDGGMAL